MGQRDVTAAAPVRSVFRRLPPSAQARLRKLAGRPAGGPSYGRVGAVTDLYYWLVEDDIDTVVPLANYFSVFFPGLDTSTVAECTILDADGGVLLVTDVPVGHLATPTLRVGDLLDGQTGGWSYGNLFWHLRVPAAVRDRLDEEAVPMLFWDRAYIGYVGRGNAAGFVHGIDKVEYIGEDELRRAWPSDPSSAFVAQPELPIRLTEYERLDVIVQNRADRARTITITACDEHGATAVDELVVPPRGVRRTEIEPAWAAGLDIASTLSLRVVGLPTRYGRPLVMKRFGGGGFSLMHC